jgi:RNA 3''-terminal phosphate cyclase
MLAPSVAFLQRCFLPLLERMGAKVELDVEREGLFPAGGGRVVVRIRPARLRPLVLNERGARVAIGAEALVANVPGHVAARELSVVRDCFPVSPEESHIRVLGHDTGPGNVLSLWVQHEAVTELVTTYGERRVSAEAVAELREKDGSLEQIKPGSVLAIVERVMDESAPQALRGDLLELLNSLDKAAGPASEQLWELANRPNDKLSLPAAQVVMRVGSAHALDAAVLLLERSDIELSMLPQSLCSTPNAAVLLGPPAKKRLSGINWSEAGEAAKWLGCLDPIGNAALLRAHLNHPSWETQIAVIAALAPSAQSDSNTQKELRKVQRMHWSGLVRQRAGESLHPRQPEGNAADEIQTITFNCFHRCLTDHLRRCGDEHGIVDGLYVSPSMGELSVEWERARRVPTPAGFPVEVPEDGRPEYGTSTYLRVENGWLYGTDRWHYDGVVGFVDDQGRESALGEWGEDVVAFVDTPHFGTVMLGSSIFTVGDAGLLAQIKRTGDEISLLPRLTLPSPPWGWAFAPNGTLLVADPYEAVAVLEDGSIESLACPVRTSTPQPRSLLAMAKAAPRALGERAQRDLDDALRLHASAFAAEKARAQQLDLDPGHRQAAETPKNVKGWLDHALDQWLYAFLEAGRADEALRVLESIASDVATATPGRRFQVYAAAGQHERARAQFEPTSDTKDGPALKMQAMLALAEGRAADAKAALGRIVELAEKSPVRPDDDPYLPLLHGLIANDWPKTDLSSDDASTWPGPIVEYLAGRSTEKALVRASHTRDGRADREKVCEALFFNGLKLTSEGKSRRAREQFRAAAELQVQHFHEHAVAMTVLGKRVRCPGRSKSPACTCPCVSSFWRAASAATRPKQPSTPAVRGKSRSPMRRD